MQPTVTVKHNKGNWTKLPCNYYTPIAGQIILSKSHFYYFSEPLRIANPRDFLHKKVYGNPPVQGGAYNLQLISTTPKEKVVWPCKTRLNGVDCTAELCKCKRLACIIHQLPNEITSLY